MGNIDQNWTPAEMALKEGDTISIDGGPVLRVDVVRPDPKMPGAVTVTVEPLFPGDAGGFCELSVTLPREPVVLNGFPVPSLTPAQRAPSWREPIKRLRVEWARRRAPRSA